MYMPSLCPVGTIECTVHGVSVCACTNVSAVNRIMASRVLYTIYHIQVLSQQVCPEKSVLNSEEWIVVVECTDEAFGTD